MFAAILIGGLLTVAATPTVEGVVCDLDGKPLAGAEVWLAHDLDTAVANKIFWEWNLSEARYEREHPPTVVRGEADAQGQFRIELPPQLDIESFPRPLELWVVSQGALRFAKLLAPLDFAATRLSVDIANQQAPVVVRDSSDRAINAARVTPFKIRGRRVPSALAERFATQTDAMGQASLGGVSSFELEEVLVESPDFGRQRVRLSKPNEKDALIARLAPTGVVVGQLEADVDLSGVRVLATTQFLGFENSGTVGLTETVCDTAGNFKIESIAEGTLKLDLIYEDRPDLIYRGATPQGLIVSANEPLNVKIPLTRAVRLSGLVREQGTGTPVAGVQITVSGFHLRATTDAEGKYSGLMDPRNTQPYAFPRLAPRPFYISQANNISVDRVAGSDDFEFEVIEVARGIEFKGKVVDEQGHGLPALVKAIAISGIGFSVPLLARADVNGEFKLEGLDPSALLYLVAGGADGMSEVVKVDELTKTAQVTVKRSNRIESVRGRVIDSAGRPVVGAQVRYETKLNQKHEDDDFSIIDTELPWSVEQTYRTDQNGEIQIANAGARAGSHRVVVSADGYLSAKSAWVKTDAESADLGEVICRKIVDVRGRVVDRQGNGIAAALVRQAGDGPLPTHTLTDQNGRFTLPGVIEGRAALIVSKLGYRLAGKLVATNDESVSILLSNWQDAPEEPLRRSLALPVPRDELLQLAESVAKEFYEGVGKNEEMRSDFAEWELKFSFDPRQAAKELAEAEVRGEQQRDQMKSCVTGCVDAEDFLWAVELLESIDDPELRCDALTMLVVESMSRAPAEARRRVLEQAAQAANGIRDASSRAQSLGMVAELMLRADGKERADSLMREAEKLISEFPLAGIQAAGGVRRLFLSMSLACADPRAGLALFESARAASIAADGGRFSMVFERFYQQLLGRIARTDAKQAAQLFQGAEPAVRENGGLATVCYWLASDDPDAALALAESVATKRPHSHAQALAAIATQIAPRQPERAAQLLASAMGRLEFAASDNQSGVNNWERSSLVHFASMIVALSEQVDPTRTREYLWRTLALRLPRGADATQSDLQVYRELTQVLSFYDRDLAEFVLEPAITPAALAEDFGNDGLESSQSLAALALCNPRRAVLLLETLRKDRKYRIAMWDPRYTVAKALLASEERRWREYCRHAARTPDEADDAYAN